MPVIAAGIGCLSEPGLFLLDGTTVSMPDTGANQALYPQCGVQKPGVGFPVAMLVAVILLGTGAVLRRALLRFAGGRSARIMTAHLMGGISLLRLPVHSDRVEPQALKRRGKTHAFLTVPRHIARAAILKDRAPPGLR